MSDYEYEYNDCPACPYCGRESLAKSPLCADCAGKSDTSPRCSATLWVLSDTLPPQLWCGTPADAARMATQNGLVNWRLVGVEPLA